MTRLRDALAWPWLALFRLSQRDERALVSTDHRRWRWLMVRTAGWFLVLLLASMYVSGHLSGGAPAIAVGAGMGLAVARASSATLGRARAYRSGWLEGRSAMVGALSEAMRRGLTPEEWLRSQLEADLALLGLPAHLSEPPED